MDRDAFICARIFGGCCIIIVSIDGLDTRFGRESTRLKRPLSSAALDRPLSVTESSQSDSTSSSMALSETSSSPSSSVTAAPSSSGAPSLMASSRNGLLLLFAIDLLPTIDRPNSSDSELLRAAGGGCRRRAMWSSNELSSSSIDDPPSVNIPFFFFFFVIVGGGGKGFSEGEVDGFLLVGCDESGPNRGWDRYEEDTREGEKPRMMLGDRTSSALFGGTLSEEDVVFGGSCVDVVTELDPVDRPDCSPVGTIPVVSVFALAVVMAVEGEEDDADGVVCSTVGGSSSGSRLFFSLIFKTMRSKPDDVICFSLPLAKLNRESSRTTLGR